MAIEAGRHPILEGIHNDFVVCNALFCRIAAYTRLYYYVTCVNFCYTLSPHEIA